MAQLQQYRQGDLYLQRVSSVPSSARLQADLVLSYGEITGHAHRIQHPLSAQIWNRAEASYLEVIQGARLIHEEHLPIALPPGVYRFWMQREYGNPLSEQGEVESRHVEETQLEALSTGLKEPHPVGEQLEAAVLPSAAALFQVYNRELRRQYFEALGLERFIEELRPRVLDCAEAPGGVHELLAFEIEGETLHCLLCLCPSSGKRYLLRVPPSVHRVAAASAWLAGFERAEDYQPHCET